MDARLPIQKQDIWHGFQRTIYAFEDRAAWIVEPKRELPGRPWSWCMEWPEAFTDRVGITALLQAGCHHVHLQAKGFGNDDDVAAFHRFHDHLVQTLGFAPKARLIGMSFGGFYALRYASAHREDVGYIYIDAPLCTFQKFQYMDAVRVPFQIPDDYNAIHDPRMPVNSAASIVGIPVLLLYGEQDIVVDPAINCEEFTRRFRAAGGLIHVVRRNMWGHHPHGVDDPNEILHFFQIDNVPCISPHGKM